MQTVQWNLRTYWAAKSFRAKAQHWVDPCCAVLDRLVDSGNSVIVIEHQ
jgi:hypothetical protein